MSIRNRLNWGTGIATIYVLFAAVTIGFVAFALGQPVELVSADYYAQSLAVDARAGAVARADALGAALRSEASADGRFVLIAIPPGAAGGAGGTVTLYRPSDAAADRVVAIRLDEHGAQRIDAADLARGRWIVKLAWTSGDRDFYREQPVMLR